MIITETFLKEKSSFQKFNFYSQICNLIDSWRVCNMNQPN